MQVGPDAGVPPPSVSRGGTSQGLPSITSVNDVPKSTGKPAPLAIHETEAFTFARSLLPI